MLGRWHIWAGGVLYGLAALLNIYLLRKLPYSVVLPLTSVTYIWTLCVSRALLGERITVRKLLGVGLIVAGACMLVATV